MHLTAEQRETLDRMADHFLIGSHADSLRAALADLDAAHAVLRTIEWCVMGEDDDGRHGPRCVVCDRHESDSHAPDCRLATVLAAAGRSRHDQR